LNKHLNFGGDPNNRLDNRDCFPDSSLGDSKVIDGHSFILIRQMAALVRRALEEVCTVSVLLVLTDIIGCDRLKFS